MSRPEQGHDLRTLVFEIVVALAVFVLALLVLFVGISSYMMLGHPVSISRLDDVRIGMSKAAVRERLGPPTSSSRLQWRYTGGTWCIVSVVFDESGLVGEVIHDH